MLASFGNTIVEYKKVTRIGTFGIVRPDFEQVWEDGKSKVSRPTKNGTPYHTDSGRALPATCRFTDDRFVLADCDFQQWMFDMNFKRSGLSLANAKKSWANLFRGNRFITNYTGSDTRRDCINGTNLDQDFMQLQPMVCPCLLKIVGESSKVFYVEAINPYAKDYTKYTPESHPHLFFTPTVSARYWVEEEKKDAVRFANDNHPDKVTKKQEQYNEPFHQFNEQTILPVMGMIPDSRSSTGWVNSVDKTRVRLLSQNEPVPNPFVMRFGRSKPNLYAGV